MDSTKVNSKISTGFSVVEKSLWLLNSLLIIWSISHDYADDKIPFLGIANKTPLSLLQLTAGFSVFCWVYFFLEVRWMSMEQELSRSVKERIIFSVCFGFASLAIAFRGLFTGTLFGSIEKTWALLFIFLGFMAGAMTSVYIEALLLKRSVDESKKLGLPRNSVAASCVRKGVPLVLLLVLSIYCFLCTKVNEVTCLFACAWALISIVLSIPITIISIFNADVKHPWSWSHGVAKMRVPFDAHAYYYFMNRNRKNLPHVNSFDSPAVIQNQIKDEFSYKNLPQVSDEDIKFDVRLGQGVKARYDESKKRFIIEGDGTVSAIMVVHTKPPQAINIDIPLQLIESHLNKGLGGVDNPDVEILVRNAVNHSARKIFMTKCANERIQEIVTTGNFEALAWLIDNEIKIDLNSKSTLGWTPLLAAVAQGHIEIAKLLLEKGANPDISNLLGATPLMYAALYGNEIMANLVISYHPNLNAKDNHGNTALMVAIINKSNALAITLLNLGADFSILNHNNKNALELAQESGLGEATKLIRKLMSEQEGLSH